MTKMGRIAIMILGAGCIIAAAFALKRALQLTM